MPARRALGAVFRHPAWRLPWRTATGTLGAWLLHASALWVWHVPRCFEAALRSDWVHGWQHACFFGSALLFWWSVLGRPAHVKSGAAFASVFTTMIHTGALGALLTLSPLPWYATYGVTAPLPGIDPLGDQQLGGLVMWVPTAVAYVASALALAAGWLRAR